MARQVLDTGTRIQRLLALLQWVAQHPDGVLVTDVCQRYDMRPEEVTREVELAIMIGGDTLDYSEMPVEGYFDGPRLHVHLNGLDAPMRLTPAEGLAVLAAAGALVGPEPDRSSPLWRALVKLGSVLGIDPAEVVDVDLEPDGGAVGRSITEAIEAGRRMRLRYWSYGRDAVQDREVDPWALFNAEGQWYLTGRAVEVDQARNFRLDRIQKLEVLDEAALPTPSDVPRSFAIADNSSRVVLDLPAEARWVTEAFPVVAAEVNDDGRLVVTLVATETSWLERLLLQVGPDAKVIAPRPPAGEPDVLVAAARRVLDRYRSESDGISE
ncbi:MAG: WYL domain-containing protein [Aquihabitans sp.]